MFIIINMFLDDALAIVHNLFVQHVDQNTIAPLDEDGELLQR